MAELDSDERRPSLYMIYLRAVIIVALIWVNDRPIVEAVQGRPTVGSYVNITLILGLAAQVSWGIWRRYVHRPA